MISLEWGYDTDREAFWIHKKENNYNSTCWVYNLEDLKDHLDRKCLTNIEYLESIGRLKEIHHA